VPGPGARVVESFTCFKASAKARSAMGLLDIQDSPENSVRQWGLIICKWRGF
jgi:hypothetical protein